MIIRLPGPSKVYAGFAAGVTVTVAVAFIFARRRWFQVTVNGSSMEPTLLGGTELLADRHRGLKAGQIVVIDIRRWPAATTLGKVPYKYLIKRLTRFDQERGICWVEGDNPESLDSRQLGWCKRQAIVGVVSEPAHQ